MGPRALRVATLVSRLTLLAAFIAACPGPAGGISGEPAADPPAAPLPPGVAAVWDLAKAFRETTPTRERICLNGLWRFQPAGATAGATAGAAPGAPPGAPAGTPPGGPGAAPAGEVPAGAWGHFKVPGCWPGVTDYMQKDCQTVFAHPRWKDLRLGDVAAAWYQREVEVPGAWAGRRITLAAEYVNSIAAVYLDGRRAGEVRFPAGEVDLTPLCRPGGKHVLSVRVAALPLKAVLSSFGDTAAPKEVKGSVARRGLCGDVYLASEPAGARIEDVRIETSVALGSITLDAKLSGLSAGGNYALRARVTDRGLAIRELKSQPFRGAGLKEGRIAFSERWRPEKLWDIHTPENLYGLSVSLVDAGPGAADGAVLDASYPATFGFRELTIEGRAFFMNGTRIWLSALPLDNAEVGAAWAGYEGVKESLLRLKSFGINFVYTHNYGCEPGAHLSFAEALRAADDTGMLVSLSQPHFGQYDWKAPGADRENGYAQHAELYTRVAGSHPSVVFYSMSHNATGYSDDMNPDLLDGVSDPRESWSRNNAKLALRAEAIVKRLDPVRIVYHHSSGNLGAMHTSNFYTNFAPIQELDDWFEGWAAHGTKPLFTCEYMVPCTWDWTMYRGWYKGTRSFGSAVVPWDFCVAEWSAQFLGDRAFRIGEPEKRNIRWEAEQYRAGRLWHRWDYPYPVGSKVFEAQHEIIGAYLKSNWRAFRTWGLSANSPWEHHFFWSLRDGADRSRKDLPVDWDGLQRPGFSADYLAERLERFDLAFERSDWIPTADGQAILRNNRPLLAYIAGKPAAFTSKDHIFTPGETFEKQIILINNSREAVTCDCRWSLGLPEALGGSAEAAVPTGELRRIPLRLSLPPSLAPGKYELAALARFSTGEAQEDSFTIDVVPVENERRQPAEQPRQQQPQQQQPQQQPDRAPEAARIALFDPRGETAKLLEGLGIRFEPVDAAVDLAAYEVLIAGKGALALDSPTPDIRRVRSGLKVLLFEQTGEVLEKRFGFRVAEYGLRQAFPRVPDHPLAAGLGPEELRDWRGDATLLPPRLKYSLSPRLAYVPAVRWCDIEVSHAWRCGSRGSVASVLIEKPARGDFLPVLDGGYSLQFSPLLECREGEGLLVFCQMDVTGRTESDPAAVRLARNAIEYVTRPSRRRSASPSTPPSPPGPEASHRVVLAGGPAARSHLEAAGLAVTGYAGGALPSGQTLVVDSAGAPALAAGAPAVGAFLKAGGRILALGLTEDEANAFLPFKVRTKKAEHIASPFEPAGASSPLAGVGPADVQNRDPREIPLVAGGAAAAGDGVLACAEHGAVVFCQLVPWEVSRARGAAPSFTVSTGNAAEGKQSALMTLGSVSGQGGRLGQKVPGGEPAKSYTFAVFARAAGGPATARLVIERAAPPRDRAVASSDFAIPEDDWTELHTTFRVEKPFPEGWFACVSCAEEGARLRLDAFRLHEGGYAPGKIPGGARNLFSNPGFEAGEQDWSFEYHESQNVRRTYRRAAFLVTRLLANLGAAGETPLLERFSSPAAAAEKRWLSGFYLDEPEEWDDPYRFFRW